MHTVNNVCVRRLGAQKIHRRLTAEIPGFGTNFVDITGIRRRRCGAQGQFWELVPENFLVDLVDVDNFRRSHIWVAGTGAHAGGVAGFRGSRRDGRVGHIKLVHSFPCISCILRFPKIRVVAR